MDILWGGVNSPYAKRGSQSFLALPQGRVKGVVEFTTWKSAFFTKF